MPTEILIRAYRNSDWERLCLVHDAARLDELRGSVGVAAFLPLTQAASNEGLFDYTVYVADVDGRVDGFVAYTDKELCWLYVDPACYRRGIGRALVQHAIDSARGPLTVEVLEGNDAALRLYLDQGFRQLRRAEGHLAGNDAFPARALVLRHVSSATRGRTG